MSAFQYVVSTDDLAAATRNLGGAKAIAVDTEFARFNTYYPMVGLIQLYDGERCYLVDPLAVGDLSPLGELLANPGVLKVLHACSEDMEVFQHCLGLAPAPVFDTQIASAALGVGFSVSYQALVERYLGVALPKLETRSDWRQRPLSDSQLEYAALDVIHLLQVYRKQSGELDGTPKAAWIEAESRRLGQGIPTIASPEESYLRVKGLWRLDRKQLNVLKALCAWREVKARKENVPRNVLVDQKALFAIARGRLTGRDELRTVAQMKPRQVRKYGDEILFLQAEARRVPEQECPERVPKPDAPVSGELMDKLKGVVQERAAALSVAPELLTTRRHLEKLLRSGDEAGGFRLPAELTGWRESAVGAALLAALADKQP